MRIVYYDESGDDGFPQYSSLLFYLTAIYMHYLTWKENYESITEFRRKLNSDYGFPNKIEMHTRPFLLDKNPYRDFKISEEDREQIITLYCRLISQLDIKVINSVIVKPKLFHKKFEVLNTALKYSIQRIENDLDCRSNPSNSFMVITDPGRLGKMRKTTRRIQRINLIPSKYSTSSYRKEIKCLIEDPLPKDSKESYFIQISDLISYVIYLYSMVRFKIGVIPNRLKSYTKFNDVIDWLNMLKPSFNLEAAKKDEFRIVYHPR